MSRHILYLHGFASSSHTTKGQYLAQRFAGHGVTLHCPDFNAPDFATMTMTRMLGQLKSELDRIDLVGADLASAHGASAQAVTLIGSSLGGSLAILAAERFAAQIEKLVLLAPAVMFAKAGHHLLPPERIEMWRRRGSLPFFHYGYGEERELSFAFYEDSLQYDPFNASFAQPTLIFQGLHDTAVDHRTVEMFARTRPNVTLSLLDDGHQLTSSLPKIWSGMQAFLGLAG